MRNATLVEYVTVAFAELHVKSYVGSTLLALLFVTQGCGATVEHTYVPSAMPAAPAPRHRATVVIALPSIRAPGAPIHWSTNMLSSATTSATVTIGNKRVGPIALSAANKHCVAETAGLACTIFAAAKPGQSKKIVVQTYASGVRLPLARGETTANVYPGSNVIAIEMAGVARKLKVRAAAKTLTHGQYLLDKVYVDAIDAAHAVIPSVSRVDSKGTSFTIDLQYSGFSNGMTEWGYYYYFPFGDLVNAFAYDGIGSGTETVTAVPTQRYGSKADVPPAKTTLTVVAGSTSLAPLMFGDFVQTQTRYGLATLAQFALNGSSSGSSAPVRQFMNSYFTRGDSGTTSWPVYGEDARGNFWIGNTHLSNSLAVLGTVKLPSNLLFPVAADRHGHLYALAQESQCAVYEYPNHYGSLTPIREIDGPCGSLVTTDASGNVYVADTFFVPVSGGDQEAFGVQEFAANGGSGHLAPIRTMVVAKGNIPYGEGFIGLDVDDAGNVYVAAQTENFPSPSPSLRVYKFAPGKTSGTVQLGGVQVGGFAVDGAGDIYAEVGTSNPEATEIQEFAPGATTPVHIFSGGNYRTPILLPR